MMKIFKGYALDSCKAVYESTLSPERSDLIEGCNYVALKVSFHNIEIVRVTDIISILNSYIYELNENIF